MAKFEKVPKILQSPWTVTVGKIVLTAAVLFISFWVGFFAYLFTTAAGVHPAIAYLSMAVLPALLLPLMAYTVTVAGPLVVKQTFLYSTEPVPFNFRRCVNAIPLSPVFLFASMVTFFSAVAVTEK